MMHKFQEMMQVKYKEEIKQKKLPFFQACRKNTYGYCLMLWDGLGFFGTDHMKLGRLQGQKVTFLTPCKSPVKIMKTIVVLSIALFFISEEFEKLHTNKN